MRLFFGVVCLFCTWCMQAQVSDYFSGDEEVVNIDRFSLTMPISSAMRLSNNCSKLIDIQLSSYAKALDNLVLGARLSAISLLRTADSVASLGPALANSKRFSTRFELGYVDISFHFQQTSLFIGKLMSQALRLTHETELLSGVREDFLLNEAGLDVSVTGLDKPVRLLGDQSWDSCFSCQHDSYLGWSQVLVNGIGPLYGVRWVVPVNQSRWGFTTALSQFDSSKIDFEVDFMHDFDWVFAKFRTMLMYARTQAVHNPLDACADNAEFQKTLFKWSNKLSVVNMDIAGSLAFNHSKDRHGFIGVDYSWWDAVPLGPLSMGIGYVSQNKASEHQRTRVWIGSINQRIGYHAGLKWYVYRYRFKPFQVVNTKSYQSVGLSLYYNIKG
ncbi:MAG: hypothetical protein VXY77_02165 [Pseudomonadota bacterium]|nr:hypothetical protein [Pseudomonadota bacterium]